MLVPRGRVVIVTSLTDSWPLYSVWMCARPAQWRLVKGEIQQPGETARRKERVMPIVELIFFEGRFG